MFVPCDKKKLDARWVWQRRPIYLPKLRTYGKVHRHLIVRAAWKARLGGSRMADPGMSWFSLLVLLCHLVCVYPRVYQIIRRQEKGKWRSR